MTSSLWNWLFFALIWRDKVNWVIVTLIEGYLRAANSNCNKLYRFLSNTNTSALNEKNTFVFWSVFFTFLLRLQIYEAIAAIFWQFASYVFTSSNKKCFALPHFAAFSTFCVKSFDLSRLVSLFSHSGKSDFEHQLLSKAIQNEQS